ncbi:cytochrome c oxidase subunit II [Egbenema bharatensis]|uniref:cytochrome c oxidase subunit II n=1 Tax=Egbenema bharatensis TaxID=3463334 RepID=UPI003A87EBCC
MKQIPVSLLTLTAGVAVTLISLWVGQNHGLLPEQASEQAPLVDGLFDVMMTIGTALFLVVEGALVYFLIVFRKRKGDEGDGIPVEENLPLEAFWTAIPAIIVIGLGIYSVAVFQEMGGLSPGSHAMMAHHSAKATLVAQAPQAETPIAGDVMPLLADTEGGATTDEELEAKYGIGAPNQVRKPADLVVNVTGIQFAWLFNYPKDNFMAGELHVPVGADVLLNLSAQDVIHSFWVPQFRLKQDAIPGERTELRFVATKPGTYPVVCTELCGSYHGGMRSQVVVHTPEEFEQWLTENRVAQKEPEVVATNVAELTPSEFLSPYSQDMGMTTDALAQLHSHL